MKNKAKPTRPFSLEYAEAKNKIINAVNEATQKHGVPFYLLEELFAVITRQVEEQARNERERAKANYEQQLAEYNRKEVNTDAD